ncbi:hypothetical protein R1flu_000850 [Riccia fluitans]|uniref:Uncharacterized protein n=1 Tax=Riccia fluitans TaxID=41844 RepID=A0ABD1Y220_9MARC
MSFTKIAGFGVGVFLLVASLAAPKVDAFIARAQRRNTEALRSMRWRAETTVKEMSRFAFTLPQGKSFSSSL